MCLKKGSDQLFVHRRIVYIVSQTADPNPFRGIHCIIKLATFTTHKVNMQNYLILNFSGPHSQSPFGDSCNFCLILIAWTYIFTSIQLFLPLLPLLPIFLLAFPLYPCLQISSRTSNVQTLKKCITLLQSYCHLFVSLISVYYNIL